MVNYAIASAIAASAVPSFIEQRGHVISGVKEVPIVVSNDVESIKKTKEAVAVLKAVGCYDDVKRVMEGKIHRSTKGKFRRSAFRTKKGPLVVFYNDNGISKAFRNIPGVDCIHVSKIELKHFAPGSQIGRLTIWTQDAFQHLDEVFANERKFKTPRSIITNTDIERIIDSDEIQSVLRPKLAPVPLPKGRNPAELTNEEEWAAAFKKIEELRDEDNKRKYTPETIKKLFEDVIHNLPASPENISITVLDHKLKE
jgi:large subunit ribosomal protein L4e